MSNASRVAAAKAEIADLQRKIDKSPNDDEALQWAIQAVELCMSALKVSSNKEDKQGFNASCRSFLLQAEKLKKKDGQPGASRSFHQASDQTVRPVTGRRDLKEPVSTRGLSKTEELQLMKASKLNGWTFWPWQDKPKYQEFALSSDGQPFRDAPDLSLPDDDNSTRPYTWVSPSKALLSNSEATENALYFDMGFPDNIDLVQDALTDCSVVASLCAAVSRGERTGTKLLSKYLYPQDPSDAAITSPNGRYVVKMNFNGCYRKVVIDDRLPHAENGRLLHVIDTAHPSLLWPALIEKAYLKIRGGYDFPGSNSGTDLFIMTGWVPEQIFLKSDDIDVKQLWRRITSAFKYGDVLITLGTGNLNDAAAQAFELSPRHDYAVLDIRDDSKEMLVKNPWRDLSHLHNVRTLQTVPEEEDTMQNERCRWKSWDALLTQFDSMYLNWNPGLFKYRQDIHFRWDYRHSRVRGTFVQNPQFLLRAADGGPVWCVLMRHLDDKSKSSLQGRQQVIDPETQSIQDAAQNSYIGIHSYPQGGHRVYLSDGENEQSAYVDSLQVTLRTELDAGKSYTIVAAGYNLPPIAQDFALFAFSNSPLQLHEATSEHPHQTIVQSAWTLNSAGGNTNHPTYPTNPQFAFTLHQRSAITALLTVESAAVHVHIKLLFSQGKRIHTIRSRDVLCDSRDYRRGSALLRSPELEPGTYSLIVSTFAAGETCAFSLRLDSDTPTSLQLLPQEGAGKIRLALSSAEFGAQVESLALPLCPIRTVRVDIRAQLPPTASLAEDHALIRIAVQVGAGAERRVLRISEWGAPQWGVRIAALDLNPAMRQPGPLWLIVQRQAHPGARSGEKVDLVLFCDKPDAITAEAWVERDFDLDL